jgi:hypothetical protein
MTKKDYQIIEKAIFEALCELEEKGQDLNKGQLEILCKHLCDAFKKENRKFNEKRFIDYVDPFRYES